MRFLKSLAWLPKFCRTFGFFVRVLQQVFYYAIPSAEPSCRTPKVPQNSGGEGGARTRLSRTVFSFLPHLWSTARCGPNDALGSSLLAWIVAVLPVTKAGRSGNGCDENGNEL